MQLSLDAVRHRYGETDVLHGIDLELDSGDIGCLLGASGCGKTTVLRCIAGFEPVTHGQIALADRVISRPGFTCEPGERGVGMVFQNGALFPHLSVRDNVAFGLAGTPPDARARRVDDLLELTGLGARCDAFPHELSGGQQQRVALARALAPDPDVVLLDEPFANLDRHLRRRLALEVRDMLRAAGTTALLVSHDQEEAFTLADHAGVMDAGRICQWGAPADLYSRPVSRRVAELVGDCSFLSGRVDERGSVETPFGPLPAPGHGAGSEVHVLIRPDDLVVDGGAPAEVTIVRSAFCGAHTLHTVRLCTGDTLLAALPSSLGVAAGDALRLALTRPDPAVF